MSYAFSVIADSKEEAKKEVEQKFADVLQSQPIHAVDLKAAQTAANAFIDVLVDDDTMQVCVSVNGYVSWRGDSSEHSFVGSNFSVSANLKTKE